MSKLFGIPHVAAFDKLQLFSLIGVAGILELVGGVLLLLGLFTRPVAFVLCGEMAFAYFIGHAGGGHVLVPMLNRGELAVLYCFVFLTFAAIGGGRFSLDHLFVRRHASNAHREELAEKPEVGAPHS